jgi:hypothetical protein
LRHSVKLRTNPRTHGWEIVSRITQKNYSYLVGMMTSPTQCSVGVMYNVVCRSMTIEARFTASLT